jgi:hypothetical protein
MCESTATAKRAKGRRRSPAKDAPIKPKAAPPKAAKPKAAPTTPPKERRFPADISAAVKYARTELHARKPGFPADRAEPKR